jgi:Fe-S oxidoreductase
MLNEDDITQLPIRTIADDCVNCGMCVKECAFLQEYGSPQKIAKRWLEASDAALDHTAFSFECSLCGLCHGVCPKDLDPSAMFLAMRRQLVTSGSAKLKQHKTIRTYEKRGSSSLFSWYYFPPNCETIFFPGCALPGNHAQTLSHLFSVLQEMIPTLGLVFDCCTKPSHDLGEHAHFQMMFNELCGILQRHGVKKVLVACPNCHRIYREYGKRFEVQTVYEVLAEAGGLGGQHEREVTIHDPCGVRHVESVQESVRTLLQQQGLSVQEMKHNRSKSFCCGEGGSAGFVRPDFARKWTVKRVEEAEDKTIISYCAGCTHFLGNSTETYHLLDLLLEPAITLQKKRWISKAYFIYWHRYRLKKRLQKKLPPGISGTRKTLTLHPVE